MADGASWHKPSTIFHEPSATSPSAIVGHGADTDRDGAPAAIRDFRDGHAQLAVDERCTRLRGIAPTRQAHDPREPAVTALDEMKARSAARASRRLLAGDQDAVALAEHTDAGRIDAREVYGDFLRVVRFVHGDGRGAFPGERLRADDAAELEEDPADLFREIRDF